MKPPMKPPMKPMKPMDPMKPPKPMKPMKPMMVLALLLLPMAAMAATVTLQWDAPAIDATHDAATGYKIYKGTGTSCSAIGPLASAPIILGNVLSYSDPSITGGTTICYEASATNAAGEGPRTVRISKVVPVNPPMAPFNPRVTVAP